MLLKLKNNLVTANRLLIFIFIVCGVVFDSDACGLIAAAYWLWLPNIERIECSVLHIDKCGINYPLEKQVNDVEHSE